MCASNSRGEGEGTRPTDLYLYFLNLISNIMLKELSYSIKPNNHPQPIRMIILSFLIKMTFTFCFENLCFLWITIYQNKKSTLQGGTLKFPFGRH